jgi:hypothetical protein
VGDDSTVAGFPVESAHRIPRTTELEGTDTLKVFTFQVYFCADVVIQAGLREYRRAAGMTGQAVSSIFDVIEGRQFHEAVSNGVWLNSAQV